MSLYRRKKNGKYLSNFWCRFTISGREVNQSTGTDNRQEAEEFETTLRSRYWRESKLGESFHTIAQGAKRWLSETEKKTVKRDREILTWWITLIGDLPLREVTREVLDAARGKLAEGLSKTTVNYYLGTLRAMMNKARDEWLWIETLPKFPMFKRELSEPRWLTRPQFQKLAANLPEHSANLARFAVGTGLRRANITGLTWDRVDLKRGTVYIPGSQAKAGRGIPVALNAEVVALLQRLEGQHATWVFTYQGAPITDIVTKAWRNACRRAGVPGFRFHDLRHTWASWQVQAETPLSALQEMGGWASFDMVKRYAHLSPGHLRQYADRTLVVTPVKKARAKK